MVVIEGGVRLERVLWRWRQKRLRLSILVGNLMLYSLPSLRLVAIWRKVG